MSVQGDGTPPERVSFDKANVDRWQVFGGIAGVVTLLLSVVGWIKDQVSLSWSRPGWSPWWVSGCSTAGAAARDSS